MHPVLFWLGSFPIYAYGSLGALAFVVGCAIVLLRARALGLDLNRVSDVIFWMAISGLVGARLTYLSVNPEGVGSIGDAIDLRKGGLVFYGSFLTGVPVGFALLRAYRLPTFAVWDLFGAAFPVAHAISRVGCFFSGCCYGTPSDGPLAVTFPHDSLIAPPGVPLHPTQLYEAVGLVAIGIVTNWFYARRRFDGQVFFLYVVLYAALRPVTEVFRGDLTRGWFLPSVLGETVSFSQAFSVLFVVMGSITFLWWARRDGRLAIGRSIQGPTG